MDIFKNNPDLTKGAAYLAAMCIAINGAERKIACIKDFRSVTGCGLKEAKDAIEMYLHECHLYHSSPFDKTRIAPILDEERNAFDKRPQTTLGDILKDALESRDDA
jgi:hypothetical protein